MCGHASRCRLVRQAAALLAVYTYTYTDDSGAKSAADTVTRRVLGIRLLIVKPRVSGNWAAMYMGTR